MGASMLMGDPESRSCNYHIPFARVLVSPQNDQGKHHASHFNHLLSFWLKIVALNHLDWLRKLF